MTGGAIPSEIFEVIRTALAAMHDMVHVPVMPADTLSATAILANPACAVVNFLSPIADIEAEEKFSLIVRDVGTIIFEVSRFGRLQVAVMLFSGHREAF